MVALVEDLARIQEHDARPDLRKLVLHLKVVQHTVIGSDLFQQRAQGRNIPLAITQRVQQLALRFLPVDAECQVERAACRNDAQVLVEDQERLAHRINDGLRKRATILNVSKWHAPGHGFPFLTGGDAAGQSAKKCALQQRLSLKFECCDACRFQWRGKAQTA